MSESKKPSEFDQLIALGFYDMNFGKDGRALENIEKILELPDRALLIAYEKVCMAIAELYSKASWDCFERHAGFRIENHSKPYIEAEILKRMKA